MYYIYNVYNNTFIIKKVIFISDRHVRKYLVMADLYKDYIAKKTTAYLL